MLNCTENLMLSVPGFWPFFLGGLFLSFTVMHSLASSRRAAEARKMLPATFNSFYAECSKRDTLKAIVVFVQRAGYKLCAVDLASGRLVVVYPVYGMDLGLGFTIFVSEKSDNLALVEVRTGNILFGFNLPPVSKYLDFITGMKAALFAADIEVRDAASDKPAPSVDPISEA